jgi:hypothetical protein
MTRAGLKCVLIILIFAFGCQNDRPTGVLSKKEYANYLVSVYLAEAKLNTLAVTPDSAMKLFQPFEQSLLKKFNTSDSVIQKTYQYYLGHPEELELVYTAVIDTLNLLEQKTVLEQQPKKVDTLKADTVKKEQQIPLKRERPTRVRKSLKSKKQ